MAARVTRRYAIKVTVLAAASTVLFSACQQQGTVQPSAENYKVVYKLGGGKNPAGQKETLREGERYATEQLLQPERAGYSFSGWFADKACKANAEYIEGAEDEVKRTVFAGWDLVTYKINLHANGGQVADLQTTSYTIESPDVDLLDASKHIHVFGGWYSKEQPDKQVKKVEKGSLGDKDFYANWRLVDYWAGAMREKTAQAKQLKEQAGDAGDQFVFITDVHWALNHGASPYLVKDIVDELGIDKVIFGGDLLTFHESRRTALKTHENWIKMLDLDASKTKLYFARGNHDGNTASKKASSALRVGNSELVRLYLDPAGVKAQGKGVCPLYYHVDNPGAKVRYLFLDTGENIEGNLMQSDQVSWMEQRILELDASWTVIVIMHKLFVYDEYDENGELVKKHLDGIYDRSRARIAGCIAGHTHRDRDERSKKGYQLVSSTCDASKKQAVVYWQQKGREENQNRAKGTAREAAFDIVTVDTAKRKLHFTRIGAGKDRSLSY